MVVWFALVFGAHPAVFATVERLIGFDLNLQLLTPTVVPAIYGLNVFAIFAVVGAIVIWIGGNVVSREA